MATAVPRESKNATQTYLDISEIRDDVIVLKDGSYRSVLACSSINFDLKSEDEKNAIIFSYQSFLNSLAFPIQILVRSRRINLDNYLGKLGEYEEAQENELIRLQTSEYIEFIRRLIEVVNIMQKTFYVIVPHYPAGLTPTGKSAGLFSFFSRKSTPSIKFEEGKNALKSRSSLVAQSLGSMGVRAAELKTQELIELFYEIYNPEVQQQEKLTGVAEITGPVVVAAPEVPAAPPGAAAPEAGAGLQAVNLEEGP
jgi:type IV secretory pathway VirB4 component